MVKIKGTGLKGEIVQRRNTNGVKMVKVNTQAGAKVWVHESQVTKKKR